jgi:hypothetical protein
MTDLRKAAEMALEALEHFNQGNSPAVVQGEFDDEIESLRQALAMENFSEVNQEIEEALKHPEQEPVAWMTDDGFYELEPDGIDVVPLYRAPPKREWVGLSNVDKVNIRGMWVLHGRFEDCLEATEAKLKEKNHGRI